MVAKQANTFKARTQLQPRCLASANCCGPMWHAGKCLREASHAFTYIMKGGEKIKTHSRHPDIVDISGQSYVPPQGVVTDDVHIASKLSEFKQRRDAEERREREARQAELRIRQQNESRNRKASGYGDSEDEFSDDGNRRNGKTKLRYGIEIELVIPYKPMREQVREWEDI